MLIFVMFVRIVLAIILLVPFSASAEIYKYVDENGVFMLTDTPRNRTPVEIQKTNREKTPDGGNVERIIIRKAKKYSLDPSLLTAVITAESNFKPKAISHKGAMGLMQLMPMTAREMGVSNPFDPEQNIEGGARYLRYLLDKYNGDLKQALAAYNAGPHRVETQKKLPGETRRYIKKVYALYEGKDKTSTKAKKTVIYRVVLDNGKVLYTNHLPRGVVATDF